MNIKQQEPISYLILRLRFCLLMPEKELWRGRGSRWWGLGSFIGGRGPCVCCCRRRTASPPRPSRGGRTAPADTLRCCAFWAWRRRRPPVRARGPGPLAGGSRGAPTAPPSGHAGTKRGRIRKMLGKKNFSRKHNEQNVRVTAV